MFCAKTFIAAVLVVTVPAWADDRSGRIDQLFEWAAGECPGCAVAVSHQGKVVVSRAYGLADLENKTPIEPGTVFDIGSLVKQFVAAATLVLVDDKRLSLDDDIRKHIPELPDYGHKITIDHLLTHTSGLRDWTGIRPFSATKDDALAIILRQRGLNFPPGEEWAYSNSGYVIMKEIVTRVSGMSFGEFTRKRLFEPLGMKSTRYHTDLRAAIKNRAQAYDRKSGDWKPAMLLDGDRGGGALFSTVQDLITWNETLAKNRLGANVTRKLFEPSRLNNGRKLDYGRGVFLDTFRGVQERWHTGSAHGYKSWLSHYPEHDLSIAILCNTGDGTDRDMFAHQIIEMLVPLSKPQSPDFDGPPPVIPADFDVSDKAGLFINEKTGEPMRLAIDRGRFRIVDGPGLVVVSENTFRRWGTRPNFMSGDAFELKFSSSDRFELKSMTGERTAFRRAKPFAPAAEDLSVLEGRYESEEVGATLRVKAAAGGVLMQFEHMPARQMRLEAIDADAFQFRGIIVRFNRDGQGSVTGLGLSNPVVRNVRFKRLGGA